MVGEAGDLRRYRPHYDVTVTIEMDSRHWNPFHKGFVSSKLKASEISPLCNYDHPNDQIRPQISTCYNN